jgi:hypothetical protein
MSHNIIISSDEYVLLRNIARMACYVGKDDVDDIMAVLGEYTEEHQRDYGDNVPLDAPETIPAPTAHEPRDLIARAERTANSLLNIGINGPRLGGWPVQPSNLMCEAAETIRALMVADCPEGF